MRIKSVAGNSQLDRSFSTARQTERRELPESPRRNKPNLQSAINKKVKRYRPGQLALQEIRRFQKSTRLLIPKSPFMRIVKEVIGDMAPMRNFRVTAEAIGALQEAAEAFLVTFFEAANRCTLHAKRVTLMVPDIVLVRFILSMFNVNV